MAGTYSLAELKEKFGISDFGDKGRDFNKDLMDKYDTGERGDGTFQLGDSGAYLDEKTFEKQRNSDETWEAYAEVYGQEAADKKREGNEDGLSPSAFDGLMDKLYEGGKDEDKEKPKLKDIVLSEEVQTAKDRSAEFIRKSTDGTYSEAIFGKGNGAGDFLSKYVLDLPSKTKAATNDKEYKGSVQTPQNTDTDNQEGF